MASAGIYINDFNYTELSQNYDPIYDTLMEGGIVWMQLDYKNTDVFYPSGTLGEDGCIHFMVIQWWIDWDGLNIQCPDGSVLCFPNGSHHSPGEPK